MNVSFIEQQFPVSLVSKESYKERKAGASQTLTVLGKWWGRKPLVLVRAALIGALMPTSDDPEKDRDIFLKIMTMDDNGLALRKSKPCPSKVVFDSAELAEAGEGHIYNEYDECVFSGVIPDKKTIQSLVFNSLSYADKLKYCERPENIEGPSKDIWREINAHLGTHANNLQELVRELGVRRFGHVPKVGDCFCGGGSNVFEPARLGCDVYASDLNPIAGMLTWGSLNLLKADENGENPSEKFIEHCLKKLAAFYEDFGIDKRSNGFANKYYLYCAETLCPDCGTAVPLIPTRIISVKNKAYVTLNYNVEHRNFDFQMHLNDSAEGYKEASDGTVDGVHMVCPHCGRRNSLSSLREIKLKNWKRSQFAPAEGDLFQERLYAIMCLDEDETPTFICPEEEDLEREKVVLNYISSHFEGWQAGGYIPSSKVETGVETERLYRERGWAFWHQLFNPRQLLLNGKLNEIVQTEAKNKSELVAGMLMVNKLIERSCKLVIWDSGYNKASHVFYNQALNTLFNFSVRSSYCVDDLILNSFRSVFSSPPSSVYLQDARLINFLLDIAITDPPYADAVNYHELTEFFLAWDKSSMKKAFPEWYSDSKRALAIKGVGTSFNESMVEVYRNLVNHMSDDGMQIIMFTHQDTKVWAELALIVWSAGLQVTAAWCIATETDSVGLKKGNYVKGTVLLVLRKRFSDEEVYPEDVRGEIRQAVREQIVSMRNMDARSEPDFNDGDYSLAAYAAALRVITSKKKIHGIDPGLELRRERVKGCEMTPVEKMIDFAKQEAAQYIIPNGISNSLWRSLNSFDRFYLKGIDMERKGNFELSGYQEIARTIGLADYQRLFYSSKANHVRLCTGPELGNRLLAVIREDDVYSRPIVSVALYALFLCHEEGEDGDFNRVVGWLREEGLGDAYWHRRQQLLDVLTYFRDIHIAVAHWSEESSNAEVLSELVSSDGI